MLTVEGVDAYYGKSHILQGVSLQIAEGEVVSLLGRNGVGKTTTILTIMGYVRARRGQIRYRGSSLIGTSVFRTVRAGVGFVPQERCIFSSLSVEENLLVAARRTGGPGGAWTLDAVYAVFPRLKERRANLGYQLSGGEQQMLSIGRALMTNPSLLLLDEPSEGLAPLIVQEIVAIIRDLKGRGLAILLVEQNLKAAFAVADRHHIMSKGRIVFEGTSEQLHRDEQIISQHLALH